MEHFSKAKKIISTKAGFIEKTHKLLSILITKGRYKPKVGQVILGRVLSIENKKWLIDICSTHHGTLDISSIHLPGNIQRRRTRADQLQMNDYLLENDLICAEVQQIKNDGTFNLQMRNLKYGKLVTGLLVTVQQELVKQLKSHMITLPMGVDLKLGLNGLIWVTYTKTKLQRDHCEQLNEMHRQENVSISNQIRHEISVVRNCIDVLNQGFLPISPVTILLCYQRAIQQLNLSTSAIMKRSNRISIISAVELKYKKVTEKKIRNLIS